MTPHTRRLLLTAHITFSVGWLGAVVTFLVLSIAGVTSRDPETVRSAYLAMKLTAWFAIVPMALASLLTGIVEALATKWGLFRHYWVLAKLVLTVFATTILLLKMKIIGSVAGVARTTALTGTDLSGERMELIFHAAGGLLVLIAITILSVFKPWGLTRFGQRNLARERNEASPRSGEGTPNRFAFNVLLTVIGAHFVVIAALHLTGYSLHGGR